MKYLQTPKGQPEAVNQRRTDNTMAKRNYIKLKIEQYESH